MAYESMFRDWSTISTIYSIPISINIAFTPYPIWNIKRHHRGFHYLVLWMLDCTVRWFRTTTLLHIVEYEETGSEPSPCCTVEYRQTGLEPPPCWAVNYKQVKNQHPIALYSTTRFRTTTLLHCRIQTNRFRTITLLHCTVQIGLEPTPYCVVQYKQVQNHHPAAL